MWSLRVGSSRVRAASGTLQPSQLSIKLRRQVQCQIGFGQSELKAIPYSEVPNVDVAALAGPTGLAKGLTGKQYVANFGKAFFIDMYCFVLDALKVAKPACKLEPLVL